MATGHYAPLRHADVSRAGPRSSRKTNQCHLRTRSARIRSLASQDDGRRAAQTDDRIRREGRSHTAPVEAKDPEGAEDEGNPERYAARQAECEVHAVHDPETLLTVRILANRQVTVREAELLRAICDTLDCPLPPLVVEEAEGR
jgi:hypothetical protein